MYKNKKTYQKKHIHKLAILATSFMIVIVSSLLLGADFIDHDTDYHNAKTELTSDSKLYKSVLIQSGDSLWSIAEKYGKDHYDSIEEYIDELVAINHLSSNQIQEGQYLVIVYFA